ncbi:MAG: DUF1460 domain-containing protein [Candidatus Krumholzibacteria bacterium]|jgi:hypothetical protein|nr:DUF1460 domain-containing protein [Candidatus Krumholzibacteria bacterium]MDP6669115.1 DUF1460 domain-containing protein [Candidatus Krumholzibacteria bacterium]MDP6796366.1 DUF1460 domain-containing protein [Candidatus Krumholzibacteria bacterium]MDP7021984.1 DUF1460 domain-containing protein [Candidatus Krumholzibacteria bacterium]
MKLVLLASILIPVFQLLSSTLWGTCRDLNTDTLYPPAQMDSLLLQEQSLDRAERIGLWARRFAEAEKPRYLFGLAEGGYVSRGLLVQDSRVDCVSLSYRVCELAQARNSEDALKIALGSRFAGAPEDSILDKEGRANYEHSSHLDYSLDMIRSGHWGNDISSGLQGARRDSVGSSRYPAGSFFYVPEENLLAEDLQEGDLLWLTLNPAHESAAKLREDYGLVIGHIGIVILEDKTPCLVHAASRSLSGHYEGGRVVQVPLADYLQRVERFHGVIVSRFD